MSALVDAGRRRFVYVVGLGMYSSYGIGGVYATPEAAMAAHPIPKNMRDGLTVRPGGWQPCKHSEAGARWTNGLDWEEAGEILRYEVEGEPVSAENRSLGSPVEVSTFAP